MPRLCFASLVLRVCHDLHLKSIDFRLIFSMILRCPSLSTASILISLLLLALVSSELIVNLTSRPNDRDGPLKWISYCLNCPDPNQEGSLIRGLNAKHGPNDFSVSGELVYCVPNHAEAQTIFNVHHFQDRIVFVDRGKIPMFDKVQKIQRSDAIGVIIADDGSCDEDFRFCKTRTGTVLEGGLAAQDDPERWSSIEIPVLLISESSAERLRKLMNNRNIFVKGVGYQNVTAHVGEDGHHEEL